MPEQETSDPARREWLLALAFAALALAGAGVGYLRERARPEAGVAEVAAEAGFRLNVNAATQDELQVLPGVGPGISARIVAAREESGPFESLEAFARAAGVSTARLGELRGLVTLEELEPCAANPGPARTQGP